MGSDGSAEKPGPRNKKNGQHRKTSRDAAADEVASLLEMWPGVRSREKLRDGLLPAVLGQPGSEEVKERQWFGVTVREDIGPKQEVPQEGEWLEAQMKIVNDLRELKIDPEEARFHRIKAWDCVRNVIIWRLDAVIHA